MAASTPPWWASLLTSVVTTVLGLVLIAIAVAFVQPADPSGSLWTYLVLGGASLAGVGGSLLARRGSDQSGRAGIGLLAVLALVPLLLSALGGCAALQRREVHSRTAPHVRVQVGPPCIVRTFADGDEVQTVIGPDDEPCPPEEYRP